MARKLPRLGTKGNRVIGVAAPSGSRWQILGKYPLDHNADTLREMGLEGPLLLPPVGQLRRELKAPHKKNMTAQGA